MDECLEAGTPPAIICSTEQARWGQYVTSLVVGGVVHNRHPTEQARWRCGWVALAPPVWEGLFKGLSGSRETFAYTGKAVLPNRNVPK